MTLQSEITEAVRLAMAYRQESQRVIGEVIDRDQTMVSNRLNGKKSWTLEDLEALAAHWGCRPWDLMQGGPEAVRRIKDAEQQNGVLA